MANYETTNTQCEELISKTIEPSYTAKSNLGNDFFNAERCNKDIDNARADINRAMHSLRCALERLDKAQACLNESLGVADAFVAIDPEEGIKCDAEIHLNSARLGAKYANRCAIKSSERILRIISELYAAGVKQDLNDEDDNCERA